MEKMGAKGQALKNELAHCTGRLGVFKEQCPVYAAALKGTGLALSAPGL